MFKVFSGMKKSAFAAMTLLAVCAGPIAARADTTVAIGKPMNVFADPVDFIVELDTAGACKSKYFHILRANANFKELTAVALTAFALGGKLSFFVTSCARDRNVVSHGYASH